MDTQKSILWILILYMAATLIIGIYVSWRANKKHVDANFLDNYFLGNRAFGGLVMAMSVIATYSSASSFLGGPGLASHVGLTQSWIASVQLGTAFLTLGIVGKKLAMISRRIDAVSISDYLRARYQSNTVVVITSLALVLFFITQMVAQFMGGATLIQSVTGLSYKTALWIFAAVVILYTAFGGFTAVAITDTIQGFIMMAGTFLLFFYIFRAGGGMKNLVSDLNANNPGWDLFMAGPIGEGDPHLKPGYLFSYWVLVGLAVMGLPQTAIRSMGFKDTQSLHRAMLIGTIVVGFLMIGMHFAGSLAFPLLPEGGLDSTDQVIPYIVLNYMPAWAAGLFIAAPLAATMSTVDSLMILSSATLIKDLYVHREKKKAKEAGKAIEPGHEKKVKRFSLIITLAIGLVTALFAINPPTFLVWINLFAMAGLEASFFWPLVGGLFWKKGNLAGCLASSLVGIGSFFVLSLTGTSPLGLHPIVPALALSGLAYWIGGMVDKREPDPVMLDQCF